MDNQQVSLLNGDPDLAWVAGIVEGEGYVGLARRIKGDFQYFPRVAITNTDELMLDEIGKILKSRNIAYYRIRQNIDGRFIRNIGNRIIKRNRRMSEICFVGLTRVKRLLDAIIPYMRSEKKERAKIILDFCNYRLDTKNGCHYAKYTNYEHNLYKQFRSLVENPRDYTLNPIRDDIVRTT